MKQLKAGYYQRNSDYALNLKEELNRNEIVITSLEEVYKLHQKLCDVRVKHGCQYTVHYRGEQCDEWDITSGIFRPDLKSMDVEQGKILEKKAILEFERVITEKIGDRALRNIYNKTLYGHDWDLLFQSQHAGIKTTLIDWTMQYPVALFFAVEKSPKPEIENAGAQFWCFMMPNEIHKNVQRGNNLDGNFFHLNPFEIDQFMMIDPSVYLDNLNERIFEYRMMRQLGKFWVQPRALTNVPFNQIPEFQNLLLRVRIPAESKARIRKELENTPVPLTRKHLYYEENPEYDDLIKGINERVFGEFFTNK